MRRSSRWHFLREAFWRPAVALVAIPYALYGLFIVIRDELIEPKDVERWKAIHYFSMLRWYWWLIATLIVALGVAIEGGYRIFRNEEERRTKAEDSLLPRFDVLPDHPLRLQRFITSHGPSLDYHRVVVENSGLDPIVDAKVHVRHFGKFINNIIDTPPTGTMGDADVALYNAVPQAFDLFQYDHTNDLIIIVGRHGTPHFEIKRDQLSAGPLEVVFSISGKGTATQHFSQAIIPQKGVAFFVGNPIAVKDAAYVVQLDLPVPLLHGPEAIENQKPE